MAVFNNRIEYELGASISKYKNRESAIEWMKRLPIEYPEYILDGVVEGSFLLYTRDYGLKVVKNNIHSYFGC